MRQDVLSVFDFGFDILSGDTEFDLKSDGLARQGLHKDLLFGFFIGFSVSAVWLLH